MAVLLAILKVFGIILAILVGMILLALLYLLFLPVHVKIYAACDPLPGSSDSDSRISSFLSDPGILPGGKVRLERGSVLGKMGSGPEEGRDERAGCARIWRRRKCSKRGKRRHPGLRPERRGFPGNLKFPKMESRPGPPKNRWEADLGKRSRRENRQKAGRQNMRRSRREG